jgi:hypothetical protein
MTSRTSLYEDKKKGETISRQSGMQGFQGQQFDVVASKIKAKEIYMYT